MKNIENNTELVALVHENKRLGLFTITMVHDWAPIVTAKTLDDAKRKFDEAFELIRAISNLNTFTLVMKKMEKEKSMGAITSLNKPRRGYHSNINSRVFVGESSYRYGDAVV